MTKALLSLHVLSAIILIGPATFAAVSFWFTARRALAGQMDAAPLAGWLLRVCRLCGVVGLLVPALGLATAAALDVLGDPWVTASIALTALAAATLATAVLPAQLEIREWLDGRAAAPSRQRQVVRSLGLTTGVFASIWVVVVVLMIVRPGSTTGV